MSSSQSRARKRAKTGRESIFPRRPRNPLPPISIIAATAMHDAALSATCKSCVLPATSQQAQRIFWYAIPEPSYTYKKTQEKLQNWGSQCTCAVYLQSKKTKKNISSKRLALLEDLKAAFDSQTGANLPKAERILDAIKKTYSEPASDVPRLAL